MIVPGGQYQGKTLAQLAQPAFVGLGDSTTVGIGGIDYITQFADLPNGLHFRTVNLGEGGRTAAEWLSDFASQASQYTRAISGINTTFAVWLGINDLLYGATDTAIMSSLNGIWSAVTGSGCGIIKMNLMPSTQYTTQQNSYRLSVNSQIAASGGIVIDVASVLNNPSAQPPFDSDGLHLVTAGYGTVAALVNAVVPTPPYS